MYVPLELIEKTPKYEIIKIFRMICAHLLTAKPLGSMNKCLGVLSKLAIGLTELVNLQVFSTTRILFHNTSTVEILLSHRGPYLV